MSKVNGTGILIYSNGTEIACQTGLSISLSQALLPASTKNSAGWEEHINGQRTASIPFETLQSTTGLSSKELYDYMINRTNLVIFILGFTAPIVCEADIESSTLNAPVEGTVGLSGTFKVNRGLFILRGTKTQLMTDPDGSGGDYDTFTVSGIKVTSAINLAGAAFVESNTFAIVNAATYKAVFFLTSNSGELPTVNLRDHGGAKLSVDYQTVAGVNVINLVSVGAAADGTFEFENTAAANWATSNIYIFKV